MIATQLAWPTGFTLAAHEVYHLILPIDERAAFPDRNTASILTC